MSSSDDLHEVVLKWPYTDANEAIVTGTFDQWSSSVRLSRTSSGFEAPVRIPWGDKIAFKFIVDGKWMTSDSAPTEADSSGFINNVYSAPPKPAPAAVEAPPAPEAVKDEPKATEAESTTKTTEPKQNGVTGAFSRAMDSAYDMPTPSANKAPSDSATEAKKTVPSAVEKAQEVPAPVVENTAQVAPKMEEVEERSAEVTKPAPSAAPEPEPARVKPLSTTASALAPTAPINIVPIFPQLPEVEIVAGSTVAPTAPAEPEPVEASTHTPSSRADAAPTSEATETEASGTVAAVETAAAGPPVVEVAPSGSAAAPELAPPVLEASAGPPKEVAPADTSAVVETAAAPATEEVPVTAAAEVEEKNEEAPEVLAAPPVAAEGAKEVEGIVVPQTEESKAEEPKAEEPSAKTEPEVQVPEAVAVPLPETPIEPAKVEEPATNGATNGTSEAKPTEPAPAAEAKPANGTANGKRKSSSDHRRASSLISALGPKKDKQAFPAEDGASQTTPSRQGSQRKKRNSIFGKIKGIFHQEKKEQAK